MGPQEGMQEPPNLQVHLQVGVALIPFKLSLLICLQSSSVQWKMGVRHADWLWCSPLFCGRKQTLRLVNLRGWDLGRGVGMEETGAWWEGGRERGRRTSRYRVEMTGTCFFTFLFLLSFLCFIKGNTKGKLCYLLKKKCRSAFQARGKKADTLLPRQSRQCCNRAARAQGDGGHAGNADSPDHWILFLGSSWPCVDMQISWTCWRTRWLGTFGGERGHAKPAIRKEAKSGDGQARASCHRDKDSTRHRGDSPRLTKAPFKAPHSLDLVAESSTCPLCLPVGLEAQKRIHVGFILCFSCGWHDALPTKETQWVLLTISRMPSGFSLLQGIAGYTGKSMPGL